MNAQELFDTVVTAIITQGKPSITARGICAYRGEKGTKCAYGHLIPDEYYTEDLEGRGSTEVIWLLADVRGSVEATAHKDHQAMIRSLQTAHDRAAFKDDFLEHFKGAAHDIADDYGLNTSKLTG